ncbi:MAG: hypothetical protein RLZZ535_10 [Cyanobacteriota bacterium]
MRILRPSCELKHIVNTAVEYAEETSASPTVNTAVEYAEETSASPTVNTAVEYAEETSASPTVNKTINAETASHVLSFG